MADQNRSTFVNVVAWIFIVFSGFASIVGLLQNLMLFFFFPRSDFHSEIASDEELSAVPMFLFEHFEWFFLAFFFLAVLTFIVSSMLLKRYEWGRKLFIGILIFLILWQIGGLIFSWTFMHSMNAAIDLSQDEFGRQFQAMQSVILIFNALIATVLSAVFAWVIKRLQSQPIRAEFS